ncbi:hypothetical protein Tco_1076219 [Tanacetum coccineum]
MEKAHSFLETYIHVGLEAIHPTLADLPHTRRLGSNGPCELCEGEPVWVSEVQDSRFQVDPWVKMGNSEIMVEDVDTQSEIEYMRICPDIGDSAGACGCVFGSSIILGLFKLISANDGCRIHCSLILGD